MIWTEFEILGLPAPQGSKTAFKVNGGVNVVEGSSDSGRVKHKAWRADVADVARDIAEQHNRAPLDGPIELSVQFRFPMPKSRPAKTRNAGSGWKPVKPDLDKLLRSLGDGLTAGGLIADDARVVRLSATKIEVQSWTGAIVRVRELGDFTVDDQWF